MLCMPTFTTYANEICASLRVAALRLATRTPCVLVTGLQTLKILQQQVALVNAIQAYRYPQCLHCLGSLIRALTRNPEQHSSRFRTTAHLSNLKAETRPWTGRHKDSTTHGKMLHRVLHQLQVTRAQVYPTGSLQVDQICFVQVDKFCGLATWNKGSWSECQLSPAGSVQFRSRVSTSRKLHYLSPSFRQVQERSCSFHRAPSQKVGSESACRPTEWHQTNH